MKYLKLGKTAKCFNDPKSFKLSGRQIIAVEEKDFTKKVENALRFKHLEEASEAEYKAWVDSNKKSVTVKEPKADTDDTGDDSTDINKMNTDDLVAYYKENYEVGDEELAEFEAKTVKEKRKFLKDLEEE